MPSSLPRPLLERTQSSSSAVPSTATEVPSGPLSGPSNTTWRRQRLLHIGSVQTFSPEPEPQGPGEETPIVHRRPPIQKAHSSYGTLPHFSSTKPSFRRRHGLPELPTLRLAGRAPSLPSSPTQRFETIDRISIFRTQRPISAYDAPLSALVDKPGEPDIDAEGVVRANGIRVWYSSFSSIDWLHDAIKDSMRMYRLRRHKSVRGRMRDVSDRSMGWIIVTIVGFLTALAAFLIVRSEQWLFDIKYGYCTTSWWRARRFCCPVISEERTFALGASSETCRAWVSWGEALTESGATQLSRTVVGRTIYALSALLLALVSSTLTLYLTASTSFVTRKDSGVLSPDFATPTGDGKTSALPSDHPVKRKVLYYAAGSGIPEIKTILSGFVIHGYLGGRTLFTKAVGLALSVASGLSLGKEGPFVHIASCIGNIVSRYFSKYENNEGKRREILSAASAAGVAVAFGAPIGGVLFSLEEVSYFFPPKVMWRSFFCAMIAAVTLRFLDPFGTGKLVLFQVTYDKDWHAYELVPFLLLGVFGGVYGAFFSKLNYRWSRDVRNKTWLKDHPIAEVLLITLITTILSFVNGYTLMGGTELVYNLFAMCLPGSPNTHAGLCVLDPGKQTFPVMRMIAVALLVKAALTVVTFGIKLPAGIFIPTLGVGACAGRIVGLTVQYAQWRWPAAPVFASCKGDSPCVIPGLYGMVGAAAALSGVTRTTISLAVIMFELTDTLTYVVPVMLAVLVAKTIADALEPKGIYELVIELAQLPYLNAKQKYIWGGLTVSDAMDRDVDVIHIERSNTVCTLRDQLARLVAAGYADTGFPILKGENGSSRMVGFIGGSELEHALSIIAEDADHPVSFHPSGRQFRSLSSSSISSLLDHAEDPFDLSVYMDKAPLAININSPLELVQQFFVKLGARYVVVTDPDGYYEGVIDKNGWLAFLGELETKAA
ncbi:chloride channel [Multifurca ochricompacta]|uniref:Chloride channel n=1 Tax=Multifurca ochricompacta TaxID=376703 RepID=A0AAD4QNH4_9AGAM|nr:chloride channel [Multifurca ochricompacta]